LAPCNFSFRKHFALRNKTIFFYVSKKSILVYGLRENRDLERRIGKQSFLQFGPFFSHFCTKSAKIQLQNVQVILLFILTLLRYAAEYVASWQPKEGRPTQYYFLIKNAPPPHLIISCL
jgi:hypothetical protein